MTSNPSVMRLILSTSVLVLILLPATAWAAEPCNVPELGVYMESRLRAGLRPTHRCTEDQARYLRGNYGNAQRAYSAEQKEYTQWMKENNVTPVTHTIPSVTTRKTFRLIRKR
jgi:hypothetical protein